MDVHFISLERLLTAFVPVLLVGWVYFRWSLPTREVGGVVALIVVAALLTDIVFLPAILRSLPPRWLVPGRQIQPSASK